MAGLLDLINGLRFQETKGGAAVGNPGLLGMPVNPLQRNPYPSEMDFFRGNPNVGGYASPDNRVVINPTTNLTPREKSAVARNEQIRILLRTNPELAPKFGLTPQQAKALEGTSYASASEDDRKATIAGRLMSGDPSAGTPTREQAEYLKMLMNYMK